jgi:hypothetical protein
MPHNPLRPKRLSPRFAMFSILLLGQFACFASLLFAQTHTSLTPGARTTLDAHNCYPYEGQWSDRIDRALAQGFPIAIEQDLFWYTDPKTGIPRSVLAHAKVFHGDEPSLETYFFERVRPIIEAELRHPNPGKWPLITLNLDIKTEEPEHLRAIYKTLQKYQGWLTSAVNTADPTTVQSLRPEPILVLAGPSDNLEQVFREEVPLGVPLLVFGAVHTISSGGSVAPGDLEHEPASNYRRWWNNSWSIVESGGPPNSGEWTPESESRLRMMVQHAHAKGLWIRFYTLDGATLAQQKKNGWFKTYNFPSTAAAEVRWRAALSAGVDYLATDQYELVGRLTSHSVPASRLHLADSLPSQASSAQLLK